MEKNQFDRLIAPAKQAVEYAEIESDAEYDRIEEIFNNLINKGEENLSAEENRLFGLLAKHLEEYESRIDFRKSTAFPHIEGRSPVSLAHSKLSRCRFRF